MKVDWIVFKYMKGYPNYLLWVCDQHLFKGVFSVELEIDSSGAHYYTARIDIWNETCYP